MTEDKMVAFGEEISILGGIESVQYLDNSVMPASQRINQCFNPSLHIFCDNLSKLFTKVARVSEIHAFCNSVHSLPHSNYTVAASPANLANHI
jgi:hypothetical protein